MYSGHALDGFITIGDITIGLAGAINGSETTMILKKLLFLFKG